MACTGSKQSSWQTDIKKKFARSERDGKGGISAASIRARLRSLRVPSSVYATRVCMCVS